MIVKMIKTIQGSKNGITVETFKEGEEHNLPKHLIDAFSIVKAIKVPNDEKEPEKEIPKELETEEEPEIKTVEVPSNKIASVPSNKNKKKGK